MARKKKPATQGRARERGETVTFTFEMEPQLYEALEECGKRDFRTKKAIITIALQDYLKGKSLWPRDEGN